MRRLHSLSNRVLADYAGGRSGYRLDAQALISITTCDRSPLVRAFVPAFHRFCLGNPRFDLLLSIDGAAFGSNPDSLAFARERGIAFLVSRIPEGVGISKNRVVARLGGYTYYFFVEDDVELLDPRVFDTHIRLSEESGIHHFSLHERARIRHVISTTECQGTKIIHALYGSAQLSFFTRTALVAAGGWHPDFASRRRGGHTEHSYRVYRNGLAPAPFNIAEGCLGDLAWANPPSVVSDCGRPITSNGILTAEQELIDRRLKHLPLATPSRFRLAVPEHRRFGRCHRKFSSSIRSRPSWSICV
jgi:hypothetical protein